MQPMAGMGSVLKFTAIADDEAIEVSTPVPVGNQPHIQMMQSAKKWRRHNATNRM